MNSFKELVEESSIFIDKAMLIKEFMDHSAQVLLITCPRRWSKSINMDMIKTFFEIEADTNGNRYKDKTGSKWAFYFQSFLIEGGIKMIKI